MSSLEASSVCVGAAASWSAAVVCRFRTSRHAESARGLAHSKTSRRFVAGFSALALLLLAPFMASAATNLSVWVYPDNSGRLISQPDALGNRVVDASGVGYRGGTVPLPSSNTVPVKVTISPVAGDNTANLQAAINYVSSLPLDTNGFRGAVLLNAGVYPCAGAIRITTSGVVLRGVGSFTNGSGTVLEATATNQYSLVQITGSGSASTSTTHNITNQYVPIGARSFNVDSPNGFAVGDHVFIRRYATSNWIHDIGMDLLTNPWTPSGYTINMDRVITRIEGNRVFVDAPVTCAIDRNYTNGALVKYTWNGRITNCGIEHIYGKSDYFGSTTNEDHGWIFVQFNNVENGWARDLVSQYFGYACVALYGGAKHVTVDSCQCLDPISIITGGRRYAFVMDDDQLCLVKNCYTRQDRHQFVTQSLTIGPNVFVDGVSDNAHAEAGPHHRWATAAIWDNITVHGHDLDAQNTCESGTGHGWEGANCVIWNSQANNLKVASPPTARNWLIGSLGNVSIGGNCHGIISQPGAWDSSGPNGPNVFPNSLYFAQLQDRLAAPGLQPREYWLGIIDGFTNTLPRDVVALDAAWSNAVQAVAGGQPLDPFNVVAGNHWIPFTFNFSNSPNEHVVAATLSLAMRAVSSADADALCLGAVTNRFSFSSLGWLPVGTGMNTTVRVLDLANQLNWLTNGQLNVAVQGDAGVDWALLELQVAPNASVTTTTLAPVADATVRGGVYANSNFGTATSLDIKNDSTSDNTRRAYLRWDLSGVSGNFYQARVVLTLVGVGTNNIEQGVAVSVSNNWSEAGVTWNNQPGGGERFANWIPATNGTVSFDVTPQVLDAMQGDRQLSLQLFSVRNVGAAGLVSYASREAPDPANRPQLALTLLGTPPTIADIADRTIAPNTSTGPIAFTIGGQSIASLTLSGSSSNQGLVPDANIVFAGSGTNRTITVTPLPNQTGVAVITVTVSDPGGVSASDSFTLTVSSHGATTIVWNGPGAGANNWSAGGNWSPAETPEFGDAVKFFDAGAVGAISNVNSFVDADFGGTIASLQFGNTNGNHTLLIGDGNSLNLSGVAGLVVGTETDNGGGQAVFATVTGNGGTLNLNNRSANLVVRQASTTSGSHRATLDLSGLGEWDATLNQILIGAAGSVARATGTLFLAQTNNLTATGSPGILTGDNNSNGGGPDAIYLGRANAIFADSIVIARQKAAATLAFNPAFPNSSAYFRAADGAGRVANWSIADHALQSSSSSVCVGTNDFSGGTVDARVDTLIVGRSQKTTGNNSLGVLTFTSGVFDVNTLQIGFQAQSNATSAGVGQVNVNGTNAVLNVNSLLELGHTSGGTGTANTFGALNVNGGRVFANAIAVGAGSGANSISVNDATLVLSNAAGSPTWPLATVAVTNSTLQFSVAAGVTNLAATTLTTGGSSNVITIASLPAAGQFPLIAYTGAVSGAGFNFVLDALPAGAFGYLFNNAANHSVDLVITNFVVPDSSLTWDGGQSSDWDTETANWKNNLSAGLIYAEGSDVMFNDSASGAAVVNLTQTLTPASVTVSNHTRPYFFADAGNLSGGMALVKQGSGSLTLANSGVNDFTGGVSIGGGTLIVGIGGVDGNLPAAGNITNDGALIFNRSDDVTVPNVISGSGSVMQAGGGVLTLNGANSFTGGLTVMSGTLVVGNAAALGSTNVPVVITNPGSLDVNGLNLTAQPVVVSGAGANGSGAIVNRGAPQTSALRTVTLAGDTTFGGTSRWDLRNTGGAASLNTTPAGGAFNLTKVGPNQVSLVGVSAIEPALGDIDLREGELAIQTSTVQLGDPNKTLTVHSNATLEVWNLTAAPLNKIIVLQDGATFFSESGTSTNVGPVVLQGKATFNIGGVAMKFQNSLAGSGSLLKTGGGSMVLSAVNTYSGDTYVNNGMLALTGGGAIPTSSNVVIAAGAAVDVTGREDGALTLGEGQTLAGNGTVVGNLTNGWGATVSPGSGSLGVLTVTGTATLRGTTRMGLDPTAGTNDVLQAGGGLKFGGTLTLTNWGGALGTNDRFKLFNAAGYGGAFTNVSPAIPAVNLAWDTNTLVLDGTLRIVAAPTPSPTITGLVWKGNQFVFSGTNGVPDWPYWVLASTNVALPLSQWTAIATNQFDANGGFTFTNAADAVPGRFYLLQMQ